MNVAMINVGANRSNPGFRGPIFDDGSFKFFPISDDSEIKNGYAVDTYRTLGLENHVPNYIVEEPVHNDPNFETFTYGHVWRGFGDKRKLESLMPGDFLFFMATLDFRGDERRRKNWINPKWGAYIIGYFEIEYTINNNDFWTSKKALKDFKDCPHFKRVEDGADFWIKGTPKSKLLSLALPLSEKDNPIKPNNFMSSTFLKGYSKHSGWYRWIFLVDEKENFNKILEAVKN